MKLLPFMDIPLVDCEHTPDPEERLKQLLEWANGDKMKISAAFVAFENDGENAEDYLFQIAFIQDGCLVTSKKMIEEVGGVCNEYKAWKELMKILHQVRLHLELYFQKIESVPPWGTSKYKELLESGRTPRILQGPNKGARLTKHQKRRVILDENRSIVYGPIIN